MSEKLKPCPFCGGEAVLNHGYMITATGQYLANVKCSECGIASRVVWSTDSPEEAVKEAIEAWNRRVATDKNVGDKERTAKVVHKQQIRIVPPKSTTVAYETETNLWDECGNCGAMGMYHGWNYCPSCGAKLDWSE